MHNIMRKNSFAVHWLFAGLIFFFKLQNDTTRCFIRNISFGIANLEELDQEIKICIGRYHISSSLAAIPEIRRNVQHL
jgi:hypothetical protein